MSVLLVLRAAVASVTSFLRMRRAREVSLPPARLVSGGLVVPEPALRSCVRCRRVGKVDCRCWP